MGLGGGRALLRVNPSLLQGPVSHSLSGLLRKQGEKKKHVGMELGRGGMQCVYAGKKNGWKSLGAGSEQG